MKRTQVTLLTITLSISYLILAGWFAPPALAGRYVLNQTPQTIQRYFGRPLKIETSATNPTQKTYFYSTLPIRRLFPSFPVQGQFGMTYVNDRVKTIWLSPRTPENGNFSYNPKAFFNYIFGYQPPIFKQLQVSGGHEGFADYKACLGDGVITTYIEYRLGTDQISLTYDPVCEPPYK